VFLQLVMHTATEWKGVEIIRHIPIRNQGRVELTSLPPGRYQFARSRTLRHGNIGNGQLLDRQFVEVASDKVTTISFVRTTGARLHGSVEWEEERISPASSSVSGRLHHPTILRASGGFRPC